MSISAARVVTVSNVPFIPSIFQWPKLERVVIRSAGIWIGIFCIFSIILFLIKLINLFIIWPVDMVLTYLAVQGVAFKCFDSILIEEIWGYCEWSLCILLVLNNALNEVLKWLINSIWVSDWQMINTEVAISFFFS